MQYNSGCKSVIIKRKTVSKIIKVKWKQDDL
jgi:hypothetical protein